jgi:hypothetical protein
MTEPTRLEWTEWQAAWSAEPAEPAPAAPSLARLRRRLDRERRNAWAVSAFDVVTAIGFCAGALYLASRTWSATAIVWAASVGVFSAIALGFSLWNRRDALVLAQPTADFLLQLRTRQLRRERVPRFLAWFFVAEIAFGLVFFAFRAPGFLPRALAIYAGLAALLAPLWLWYRHHLARLRRQLEAVAKAAA